MEVAIECLQNFNELEIIAHCIYEMTFVGFEEEEIQEKIQNIEAEAKKYKNMTEEERKENTTSLDDLFKDLDDE
jgi:N12 class adenine-specific DNA methylase